MEEKRTKTTALHLPIRDGDIFGEPEGLAAQTPIVGMRWAEATGRGVCSGAKLADTM
ncbi:hypothetical protein ERO13_A10G077100v2 [Gossypium hirsutum]|uniref:Uncharacterized protein n=2 Tax=Gossypium TaxID=3633 RepID=A0A5D2NR39_GOSTO|nr:hypothetical protein ERO13_A10G077100v2 [Gossypium hirsutum]TYG98080.1 hypothetical protein ES288_A10G089100v1 [Gossypium darwinii]TYI05444.1 hypothetical protein ES332_A10G088300v1 [Gossypium tomentosum]